MTIYRVTLCFLCWFQSRRSLPLPEQKVFGIGAEVIIDSTVLKIMFTCMVIDTISKENTVV